MSDDGFATIARDLRAGKIRRIVDYSGSLLNGSMIASVLIPDLRQPVATVWYGWNLIGETKLEIYQSYVTEPLRRCGLRTYLHQQLLLAYPTVNAIVTAGATPEGKAWLEATGFKRIKGGGWEYRRPKQQRGTDAKPIRASRTTGRTRGRRTG